VPFEQRRIDIGDGLFVNTIVVEARQNTTEASERPPLVLLHGFAGAAGFWVRNLEALSAHQRVVAIDLVGFGRSSRPELDASLKPHEAEAWWVDSIEKWRQQMGFERMHLCGHSLGGFLASAYALKHPQRLHGLILASPAGIPHYDETARAESNRWRVNGPWLRRTLFTLAEWAWRNDVSPQDLIRWLGPWGAGWVKSGVTRRFNHVSEFDAADLSDYVYHTFVADKSGEVAFLRLFDPWPLTAKDPLVKRVDRFAPSVPTLTLFGQHDWMKNEQATAWAQTVGQVQIIPACGHQLFIENPSAFNAAVSDFCLAHGKKH